MHVEKSALVGRLQSCRLCRDEWLEPDPKRLVPVIANFPERNARSRTDKRIARKDNFPPTRTAASNFFNVPQHQLKLEINNTSPSTIDYSR